MAGSEMTNRKPEDKALTNRNPARRLMSMIGKLHEVGYQKVKLYPHIGGAGFWRYIISVSLHPNMRDSHCDHKTTETVWQSLGGGDEPYGWGDSQKDTIEELAHKFLHRYQRIETFGKGDDPIYVKWYQDMLKKTEPGGVIYFWWDGCYKVDRPYIGILNCGRRKINIPYPPDYPKREDSHYPIWL